MTEEERQEEIKRKNQAKLVDELETEPDKTLSAEQLKRVTQMVSDYKGRIKTHLNEQQEQRTRWSERLADQIACFGGSWAFIIWFILFLGGWMIWNVFAWRLRFDEPPFILLNLILSCLAAFQAPVILMSQNRQAARDKQESVLSFAINYKAEQENIEIQEHLSRIERQLELLMQRLPAELDNDRKNDPYSQQ